MAGISTSRSPRRYLSISPSSGWSEFNSRLVVERSLRRRSMALNMLAEASATAAIRLVNCRRSQESQAVSEKPRTMQNAVVRITAWSSVETVRRFNMDAPQNSRRPFRRRMVNIQRGAMPKKHGRIERACFFARIWWFRRGNLTRPSDVDKRLMALSQLLSGGLSDADQRTRH